MPIKNRRAFLDDEHLMIRNSGEIPEVALYDALHYLTQDVEGPGLKLTVDEVRRMKKAVIERYQRIIRRDLDPRLRDKSVYRGIERSITNWERLCRFAAREHFTLGDFEREMAKALRAFLELEITDVTAGTRITCVNCTWERLQAFSLAVGCDLQRLPAGWQRMLGLV